MTHDADHEVARYQPAIGRGVLDASERLVSDDEALMSRWRGSVAGRDDIAVRPADSEGNGLNEDAPAVLARDLERIEAERIGDARLDRDGLHGFHRAQRYAETAPGAMVVRFAAWNGTRSTGCMSSS